MVNAPVRRDQSGHAWRKARARAVRSSDGHCTLCGKALDLTLKWPHPDSISVDHIVPVSKGGRLTAQDNLRVSCLVCNQRRGNRDYGPSGTPCVLLNHLTRDWFGENLEACKSGGFHALW